MRLNVRTRIILAVQSSFGRRSLFVGKFKSFILVRPFESNPKLTYWLSIIFRHQMFNTSQCVGPYGERTEFCNLLKIIYYNTITLNYWDHIERSIKNQLNIIRYIFVFELRFSFCDQQTKCHGRKSVEFNRKIATLNIVNNRFNNRVLSIRDHVLMNSWAGRQKHRLENAFSLCINRMENSVGKMERDKERESETESDQLKNRITV